ncbi:MAG: hypothetical protein V5A22_14360 [Salinivenus sp.]
MPDPDELNPHEDENLRNVWKQGWRAYFQDKGPPEREVLADPEERNAWLDGYICARASEGGA